MILEFRSADRRFGLLLSEAQLGTLERRCAASHPLETGGILVGRYSPTLDLALVTRLPPAPSDSERRPTAFLRGVRGLAALLARIWNRDPVEREYYLGEWHYHPDHASSPSRQDLLQMLKIATSPEHQCSEPLLLIVGGGPPSEWSLSVQVYLAGVGRIALHPVGPS